VHHHYIYIHSLPYKFDEPPLGSFNLPRRVFIVAKIRHRHIITVLLLRDRQSIAQERKDIVRLLVLNVKVFEAWSLEEFQVVVQAAWPDVDSSIWFAVLVGGGNEVSQYFTGGY